MSSRSPITVVLSGPNGAGKTTAAPLLLRGALGVDEYVNPDLIAQGLSAFGPETVAVEAARIMLDRIRQLASRHLSFALETTLASRAYVAWVRELQTTGYRVHLLFLWLPSPNVAVQRVAERVRMGGHDVPADTVRHRYEAGLHNFFELYQSLVTTWRVYDSSVAGHPRLIAAGGHAVRTRTVDLRTWQRVHGSAV